MKKLSFILALILILSLCPTASAMEIPDGAYGVLSIPCLKIKMPVYAPEVNDHDHRQAIIDEEESAVIDNWQSAYLILDHLFSTGLDGEGEWLIQQVFAGAHAYFYTINGNYYMECYLTAKTEYDGNEYTNGRMIIPCSSYDLLISCCTEYGSSTHYVAVFRRLREFP